MPYPDVPSWEGAGVGLLGIKINKWVYKLILPCGQSRSRPVAMKLRLSGIGTSNMLNIRWAEAMGLHITALLSSRTI